MDVSHLVEEIERALEEGAAPFMVSATSGTTVIGAFDPLDEIADVCQKYGLWMHVDAAWGGGALMSKKHRHLLKGVERYEANSGCIIIASIIIISINANQVVNSKKP